MELLPADSKLDSAKYNLANAIILYMHGRYFGAWTLAQMSYQVILDLIPSNAKPYLKNPDITSVEFADLDANSRKNLNATKHAKDKKRKDEGVYHTNEEDARFRIFISLLELQKNIQTQLLAEHELFIAWCNVCIPGHCHFPCPDWANECIAELKGKNLEFQQKQGLEIIISRSSLPTPSRERLST